jgi:hypothetical protein
MEDIGYDEATENLVPLSLLPSPPPLFRFRSRVHDKEELDIAMRVHLLD